MKENRRRSKRNPWLKPNTNENRATSFSNDPQNHLTPLVGLVAETTTALKPTGEIEVDDQPYNAVALGTYIGPLEKVRITGTRDFRLTVERLPPSGED